MLKRDSSSLNCWSVIAQVFGIALNRSGAASNAGAGLGLDNTHGDFWVRILFKFDCEAEIEIIIGN